MPVKTTLTIAAFAALILTPRYVPQLKNYASFDPRDLPRLWDLPVPKIKSEADNADVRIHTLQSKAPSNLTDPAHSLNHFYSALLDGGTVRILHYGDSPTTGDLITADARADLQKEFGDAGSGFILIARPWAWYNHRGVEMEASSNWKIDIAGIAQLKDGMHGLGGVSFIGNAGATAHWRVKAQSTIEVAYLAQPDGGDFEVDADDKALGVVATASETRAPAYAPFKVPEGAASFTVRVTRGSVRLYGAEFRKSHGVIYSALGINGANVTLLSRSFNGPHWQAELRHYKPDLVIVNYGTNESGYPDFVNKTWTPEMKEVVRRLHAALPNASILLMSPMDRGERKIGGDIETTPTLPRLVQIEARIASETGTAFFNTFEAMGGEGTMARWYNAEPRLVSADFIHPMPAGAKIVGDLLYNALRDGYNEYKLAQLNKSETHR